VEGDGLEERFQLLLQKKGLILHKLLDQVETDRNRGALRILLELH
jgi:hypothetical protein